MWPVALSGRLPVKALVSHYPTNKLISRESIQNRRSFPTPTMQQGFLSGISPSFLKLSRSQGQVTHVLLTRSPLEYPRRGLSVRLACVKHAASVRPEPGSNSQFNVCLKLAFQLTFAFLFSPNYCLVCTSLKVFTLFNLLRFYTHEIYFKT